MKPFISLCMIVKNEEKVLQRCLDSVKGIVDEIVIVDTGSTDRTQEIALGFVENVYHFEWTDSFADARNFAASKATGDWILVLDADEFVDRENLKESIENIKIDPNDTDAFVTNIFNFVGVYGEQVMQHHSLRIYKNTSTLKFVRSIHEQIVKENAELIINNSNLIIYHSGYLNKTIQEKNKTERNTPLVKRELVNSGGKGFDFFNLGNEYFSMNKIELALDAFKKAYLNKPGLEYSWVGIAVIQIINCLTRLEKYQEALNVISDAEKIWSGTADFKCLKGNIYFLQKRYEDAKEELLYLLENKELYKHSILSVDFIELYPQKILANIFAVQKDYSKAVSHYIHALNINRINIEVITNLTTILVKNDANKDLHILMKKYNWCEDRNVLIHLIRVLLNLSNMDIAKDLITQLDDELLKKGFKLKLQMINGEFDSVIGSIQKESLRNLNSMIGHGCFDLFDLLISGLVLEDRNFLEGITKLIAGEERKFVDSLLELSNSTSDRNRFLILLERCLKMQQYELFEKILLKKKDFDLIINLEIGHILFENGFTDLVADFYKEVDFTNLDLLAIINTVELFEKLHMYDDALEFLISAIEQDIIDFRVFKKIIQLLNVKEDKEKVINVALTYFPDSHWLKTEKQNNIKSIFKAENKYTSIIILTHNKLDYTKLCLESIRKYTKQGTYELIVVDNHSTDGTVEWLETQKDIKPIYNNRNLGFPKGCNQGIEIANGDNILLLNNDTVVSSNWLENLMTCLYSTNNIGAVGPVTNNCSNYQTIDVNYNTLEEMQIFANNFNSLDPDKWEERIKLVGFCLLIKKEVVDKIGLLDEIFSPGNYEDDDYSFRIRQAGFKLILCNDTFIHHFGSSSFNERPIEYHNLLKRNEINFEKKWGFNLNYSSNIRFDLISLIDSPKDKEINILEVGCACGATLLKIKNIYKNANLYGIELNEKTAEFASLIADIQSNNIEHDVLKYEEGFFDYIIFGDVLEHLYNPWEVISEIRKFLKDDGKLLVSIPNVSHFSLIRDLINGNWTYTNSGLLDQTHIRFFTLSELSKMFIDAKYEKIDTAAITIPKTEKDKSFIEDLCKLANRDMTDQFNAYQYLLKVYKTDPTSKIKLQLKFLLRRIENGINAEESLQHLIEFLINEKTNYNELIKVINEDIIEKESILNLIAVTCFENNFLDYVIPFLQAALEINSEHVDTLFNLGSILSKIGEKEMALSFLERIKEKDELVLESISKITEGFTYERK